MADSKNPPVVPYKKLKEEDNTQQVCEECGAEAISISRGCTHCVDKEFEDKYGSTRGPRKEGVRIGMLNANSMLRKMDLITALIHSHQFDIFVVVETWLNNADVDVDVAISDYKKIRFDRLDLVGGGIIIYHRECFVVEENPEPKERRPSQEQKKNGNNDKEISRHTDNQSKEEPSQDQKKNVMQYIHVKVTPPHQDIGNETNNIWKFHLFAIYNPEKEQRKTVLEYMKTAYNTWRRDNIVMLGDLNVEPMKEIEHLGAKQIIKHPAFVTGNNSRTIDHIYTNIRIEEGSGGGGGGPGPGVGQGGEEVSSSRIVESGVIRSAISDHDVVFCTVKLPKSVTLPNKCFASDTDIKNLFDSGDIDDDTSITELMQQIREKTKNLGPIHNSYSTPSTPSDIMTEGIREIERRKIEAMKSRSYELKWKDISSAKDPYLMPQYQPKKTSKKNIIQDFAECSEFLTSSSILSWSRNTGEEVTQEEVKTAIEWVIRYRANKVGRFHEVEELVKEWTSGPVLNALIKGYKIFFGPNSSTQAERGQSAGTPTSTKSTSTIKSIEEEEEEESSVEGIIYGVFDYLNAVRTEGEVDIVKSRAQTLKELHTFLESETKNEKYILADICKCSVDTNFKKYLNDMAISGPFDKARFDGYWSKRKIRVEIKESPLFQRYLAAKRAEFRAYVPEDCKMFASADEIFFCMTFAGGLTEKRNRKEKEDIKKKLISMKEFKEKVLSVYNENIGLRVITEAKPKAGTRAGAGAGAGARAGAGAGAAARVEVKAEAKAKAKAQRVRKDNINTISRSYGPVDKETAVTFLVVKIDPRHLVSEDNMKTLQKLERMECVNKSFASEESSLIESVRLFTKGKV